MNLSGQVLEGFGLSLRDLIGQVLEGLEVEERAAAESLGSEYGRARAFRVRLRFAPPELYPPEAGLSFGEVRGGECRLPWPLMWCCS